MRTKRLLLILGGSALGSILLAVGALTLLWLSCESNVTIWVTNDSGSPLQNVAVIVPGSQSTSASVDMPPGIAHANVETRTKLPIRVVFDAGGRHHDVPAELRPAPFGPFVVSISIGREMQISIKTKLAPC